MIDRDDLDDPDEEGATPRRGGVRLEHVAWCAAIALLVGFAVFSMPDTAPPPGFETPRSPTESETAGPTPETRAEPVEQAATSPATPLPPTGRLVLEVAQLADGRPLTVHLALPEPSRNGEPRPVRLISQPDHRILELDGALSDDRTRAAIEVDPSYLTPGVYLVEVRTTELGHLPLRRYGIVVRH